MKQLVVVGNGMAGIACVEQILKRRHDFQITIFGDETHVNYNRILLSSVLAGEKSADEIVLNSAHWYRANGIRARLGSRVLRIDRENRCVAAEDGCITPFDRLILATGSRPYVPQIRGIDKKNVHVLAQFEKPHARFRVSTRHGGELLPTPRPYARFPFFNMRNTEGRFGALILRPHAKVTISSEFHSLRLSSADDLWYSGGVYQPWTFGYTGRSTSGRRSLGNLYDANIEYRATRYITATAYLGYTQGLAVMEQIYPLGKDGQFGYLELLYRF